MRQPLNQIMMPESGSIESTIEGIERRRRAGAGLLHRRCWPWMVQRAQQRLGEPSLRASDEEDVAEVTVWGFVRSFQAGRIPQLASRHDLFAL